MQKKQKKMLSVNLKYRSSLSSFSNQQLEAMEMFNPVFKYEETTQRRISLLISRPNVFKVVKRECV